MRSFALVLIVASVALRSHGFDGMLFQGKRYDEALIIAVEGRSATVALTSNSVRGLSSVSQTEFVNIAVANIPLAERKLMLTVFHRDSQTALEAAGKLRTMSESVDGVGGTFKVNGTFKGVRSEGAQMRPAGMLVECVVGDFVQEVLVTKYPKMDALLFWGPFSGYVKLAGTKVLQDGKGRFHALPVLEYVGNVRFGPR